MAEAPYTHRVWPFETDAVWFILVIFSSVVDKVDGIVIQAKDPI